MKAEIGGHTEIVSMLVAAGADPQQVEEVKVQSASTVIECDF